MKTLLKAVALAVFAVGLAVSAYVTLKLDDLLRSAIVDYGPRVTRTKIDVKSVHVSPWVGRATIKGLVVGNPQGFSSEDAFSAETIRASIVPKSLLTDDVVVELVEVDGAKVNLEGQGSSSNLTRIEANANSFSGELESKLGGGAEPGKEAAPAKPSKRVVIKRFVLRDAEATARYGLISDKAVKVKLPEIELRDLAAGDSKAAMKQIVARVMKAVQDEVVKAAAGPLNEALRSKVSDLGKSLGVDLGGLFKKKKQ